MSDQFLERAIREQIALICQCPVAEVTIEEFDREAIRMMIDPMRAACITRRAEQLREGASEDELRLAGHLVELAWLASPEDPAIQAARQRVFSARAEAATSTMAKGVFGWAARESTGEQY